MMRHKVHASEIFPLFLLSIVTLVIFTSVSCMPTVPPISTPAQPSSPSPISSPDQPNNYPAYDPCSDRKCMVDEIILNTGYNQATGQLYTPNFPATDADPYWNLVDAPDTTDNITIGGYYYPAIPGSTTSLTMPSPAWIITKDGNWYNLPIGSSTPQSRWISAYKDSQSYLNNTNPLPQWIPVYPDTYKYASYAFERCFCTCKGTDQIRINFDMLVDNVAHIYFDGHLINQRLEIGSAAFTEAYTVDNITAVKPGMHCLRIEVRNRTGVAMGLNVLGTVRSEPPGSALFLKADCCQRTGKIIGQKINDIDCNGKIDTDEPKLQGWTITATNTSTGAVITTVTDANGFYYFNNLAPGTYTISEQVQSGWTQTYPASPGTYTVTVKPGEIIQQNFANCNKPCAAIVKDQILCVPNSPGNYTYTFNVSNLSSVTAYYNMVLTPLGNFTITPASPIHFNNTLGPNQISQTITVNLNGIHPGDCFMLTLIGINQDSEGQGPCPQCCCSIKVCPQLPACDCMLLTGQTVTVISVTPPIYNYHFCITPEFTVTHIYLYPPSGITMQSSLTAIPNYIPVSIPAGATFCTDVSISGAPSSLQQLQFGISIHDKNMTQCCTALNMIHLALP